MPRHSPQTGLLLTLCAGIGFGQQSQFSAILAGPVFDPPTAGIRMVFGYPGAARINQPVYSGLDDAVIAPDGKAAIVLRGSRIAGLRFVSGGPVQEVDFGTESPRLQAAWSPDSQAAVAWFADADQVLRFQFWGAKQQPVSPVPSPFSPDSVQCVRLLQGGDVLLAAVKDGERSGIYRVASNGGAVRIAVSEDPAAMTVDAAAGLFYFVDRRTSAIMRQPLDGSTGPEPAVTDGSPVPASQPSLAVLKGRRLAIADSSSRSVFLYGLDNGSLIGQIQLESAPEGFLPLGGSDWLVVSLRHQKTDSLLLLDARSDTVYFVPADDN